MKMKLSFINSYVVDPRIDDSGIFQERLTVPLVRH